MIETRLVVNALKLLHGMELMLCFLLFSACSTPAPADAIEFAPAATVQAEQTQNEPALAAIQAEETTPEIRTIAPSASPVPAAQAPALAEAISESEEAELTAQPAPAPVPMETPAQDMALDAIQDEILSLQSVVEYGSVMRIQIPRALVREGISPAAEYHVKVTYSSKELLSCVVEVIQTDAENTLVPLTLDLKTGKSCKLSDFFTLEDNSWKGLLPDIVTELAEQKQLTLLCEVPPVGDDQPFYIEDGNIVLLYRPYEITTYDAGAPTFVLPEKELAPYMSGAYGIGE